jgi:hypothetical protein
MARSTRPMCICERIEQNLTFDLRDEFAEIECQVLEPSVSLVRASRSVGISLVTA